MDNDGGSAKDLAEQVQEYVREYEVNREMAVKAFEGMDKAFGWLKGVVTELGDDLETVGSAYNGLSQREKDLESELSAERLLRKQQEGELENWKKTAVELRRQNAELRRNSHSGGQGASQGADTPNVRSSSWKQLLMSKKRKGQENVSSAASPLAAIPEKTKRHKPTAKEQATEQPLPESSPSQHPPAEKTVDNLRTENHNAGAAKQSRTGNEAMELDSVNRPGGGNKGAGSRQQGSEVPGGVTAEPGAAEEPSQTGDGGNQPQKSEKKSERKNGKKCETGGADTGTPSSTLEQQIVVATPSQSPPMVNQEEPGVTKKVAALPEKSENAGKGKGNGNEKDKEVQQDQSGGGAVDVETLDLLQNGTPGSDSVGKNGGVGNNNKGGKEMESFVVKDEPADQGAGVVKENGVVKPGSGKPQVTNASSETGSDSSYTSDSSESSTAAESEPPAAAKNRPSKGDKKEAFKTGKVEKDKADSGKTKATAKPPAASSSEESDESSEESSDESSEEDSSGASSDDSDSSDSKNGQEKPKNGKNGDTRLPKNSAGLQALLAAASKNKKVTEEENGEQLKDKEKETAKPKKRTTVVQSSDSDSDSEDDGVNNKTTVTPAKRTARKTTTKAKAQPKRQKKAQTTTTTAKKPTTRSTSAKKAGKSVKK